MRVVIRTGAGYVGVVVIAGVARTAAVQTHVLVDARCSHIVSRELTHASLRVGRVSRGRETRAG
jgi:hypothetical protein